METRSWGTDYRGPIAIHASAKIPKEARAAAATYPFYQVLCARLRKAWRSTFGQDMPDKPDLDNLLSLLPLGAVVGVGDLANITTIPEDKEPTGDLFAPLSLPTGILPPYPERSFGIYTPGRKFWQVDKLRPLDHPIPTPGAQGLREITDPILEGLISQMDPGWEEFVCKAQMRAAGACLCPVCGVDYLNHPMEEEFLSYQDLPFLHRLCSGEMVKL